MSAAFGRVAIPIELLRRSCRNSGTKIKSESEISRKDKELESKPPRKVNEVKLEKIIDQANGETIELKLPQPDGFLDVDEQELDLERTLLGGQSFRWTKSVSQSDPRTPLVFTGVVQEQLLQLWRVSPLKVAFKRLDTIQDIKPSTTESLLQDYFQLKYKLKDLYEEWSSRDEHLAKCCKQYTGFRILRQDPAENVFSFICATNNNIKRISLMIEKLCQKYGRALDLQEGVVVGGFPESTFPSIERLSEDDVFECLRYELGFGYRAKFISETAKKVVSLSQEDGFKSPRDYLLSLRNLPYKETCKKLMQFPGIGRKVADCICLMSMDHLESVPIDCHIYEIVCRHYMPTLRQERKTLTESVHDLIGDHFKDLHGSLAGWSTSVLFIAELRHLKQASNSDGSDTKKHKKDSNRPSKKKKTSG